MQVVEGRVSGGGGESSPRTPSPTQPAHPPTLPRSFLIGEDGLVYEGRGWDIKGDHSGAVWNPMSIGITFMGNYMGKCPAVGMEGRLGVWGMARRGMESPSSVTLAT